MFVDASGVWHLYYQYNANGTRAGNQHWGHATSRDLFRWINQPIALFPPEERVYVFSGSAVVDENNTSGFFPDGKTDGVVAIFTLARYYADGSAGPQTQDIAYSLDGGYTFQMYDNNPVINSTSTQFRDPKVIRYGDTWVMVLAYAQEFVVGVFTSPDLKNWTHASNFTRHGLLGAQYECPNLTPIPIRDRVGGTITGDAYLMSISLQPGAPLGGSVTQYFIGGFNGTHFETWDAATRLTDFGKDNYAAQFFYGTPGVGTGRQDAVSIGWASNWQYAQMVPTGPLEGWRSAMTLPRRHYVTNVTRIGAVMVSELVDPAPVLDTTLRAASWGGDGTAAVDFSTVSSGAVYIEANVTGLNASTITGSSTLNITFASATSGESLKSGYYFGGDQPFFVDRGHVLGFDSVFFTDKMSVADVWKSEQTGLGTWRVQAVLDRSVYEVFLEGGIHAGTFLVYPNEPLSTVTVATAGMPPGTNVSVAIWGLKSTWAEMENEQGIVAGNVTKNGQMGRRDMEYEAQF